MRNRDLTQRYVSESTDTGQPFVELDQSVDGTQSSIFQSARAPEGTRFVQAISFDSNHHSSPDIDNDSTDGDCFYRSGNGIGRIRIDSGCIGEGCTENYRSGVDRIEAGDSVRSRIENDRSAKGRIEDCSGAGRIESSHSATGRIEDDCFAKDRIENDRSEKGQIEDCSGAGRIENDCSAKDRFELVRSGESLVRRRLK